MLPHKASLDTAAWEDGSGISIDYCLDVIQDLRRLSVDGFNAFAHGGREIGGVLYGRRDESQVSVLAYSELECSGLRFFLSEKDHTVMAALMKARDGLQAIGWFRAHTRAGLELDAKDRELFDRYFERPLSVGLILKPTQWGSATATFYVRQASGEVGPESVREFAIETPRCETAEEISVAAETLPARLAPTSVAIVVAEPAAAAPAALGRRSLREAVSPPRRSWAWGMCAGALLGTVITLALESRPARQVHAHTPPQPRPAEDFRVATAAELAEPVSAASPLPQPAIPTEISLYCSLGALEPPVRKDGIKPGPRQARIPRIAPAVSAPSAPLPAPPLANLGLTDAPNFSDLPLNPLLSLTPPPAVTAIRTPAYAGPRQGRLIWAGDLARHGVIEMDGSRVSLGSLTGALPGLPLALRIMPAEFSRDGLTVFTTDLLRDNKTEPPAKSNGWNGLHFKVDASRVRELVVLETPNAANDYKRLVVRNDGRPYSVVLVDWNIE
jgi:hypothetical protein